MVLHNLSLKLKQDSFRNDAFMESDIELGSQSGKLKSAPDYGMDDFFDQVKIISNTKLEYLPFNLYFDIYTYYN